jgi:hypothetical protein
MEEERIFNNSQDYIKNSYWDKISEMAEKKQI